VDFLEFRGLAPGAVGLNRMEVQEGAPRRERLKKAGRWRRFCQTWRQIPA
jgi:hypothetical protein